MKLREIGIKNFRNLDGIKLILDPIINFVVGETNLGKSNFLSLLNTIFNRTSFNEIDFDNPDKPIEVSLKLTLDDIEIGLFEDLFDPSEHNAINIKAKQETIDENIQFFHEESSTNIPAASVKCLNYIYYDPLRNPAAELTFDKRRGVGRFLNHIFKKYLEARKIENIDFINEKELAGLLAFINDNLNKIKSFKDFSILASIEDDTQDLLARVVSLKDENNFSLHNSGYGVQFLSLICLTIFEKLLVSSKYKSTKGFFEDAEGKKYVPVLLGLDEPEIHLHPYMQRSLINYLISIVSNNDSGFLEVLSKIFSVDRFFGQIIISTHSPNILLSDYKQIIRFCKDKHGRILAKNGLELLLQPDLEKHLLKNMPYVKESFFSKCVILVEGDTELGAFPVFAQSMKINLDDFGISVIQAGSADSIPPLMKMLDQFNISNVGIMDADKYDNKFKDMQNLYHTDESDFEEEVVRNCFNLAKEDILRDLVKNNDVKGLSRTMSVKKLNSIIAKYHIDMEDLNADYDFTAAASDVRYILYLAWLEINKSIILGRTIGEILPAKFIPNKFKQIINAAVRISQNA